jgi:hypothetical protein
VSAALRVRGPGLDWLPPVLCRRATWRTVWRFFWLGPLVGVLPWAWLLVSIPIAYAVGGPAAFVAGLLFAIWYHRAGRTPTWPWRATLGALAGVGAVAVVVLVQVLMGEVNWGYVGVVAVHGVPAAVVLALLQKPADVSGGCRRTRQPTASATLPASRVVWFNR